MRLHEGEDFTASGVMTHLDREPIVAGAEPPIRASVLMRRVGWLDQKGRVWLKTPPSREFDGGSLTPLLIQIEGD
jgi:hypothetical protein